MAAKASFWRVILFIVRVRSRAHTRHAKTPTSLRSMFSHARMSSDWYRISPRAEAQASARTCGRSCTSRGWGVGGRESVRPTRGHTLRAKCNFAPIGIPKRSLGTRRWTCDRSHGRAFMAVFAKLRQYFPNPSNRSPNGVFLLLHASSIFCPHPLEHPEKTSRHRPRRLRLKPRRASARVPPGAGGVARADLHTAVVSRAAQTTAAGVRRGRWACRGRRGGRWILRGGRLACGDTRGRRGRGRHAVRCA